MRFKDRVGVITGSGRGLWKAIAEGLASEGASVVISDVDRNAARETAKNIQLKFKAKALSLKTDVRLIGDIQHMINTALKELGKIDILVNNAGICSRTSIEDVTETDWDNMLSINLRAAFFCSQAVTPLMKTQKSGAILNIASLAGQVGGVAVGAHYSASKAGVICLTKSFAKALAPFGVRVNAIAPCPIHTAMIEEWPDDVKESFRKQIPLGRFAETEDVTEPALFLLSDGAKFITGETLNVNGGILMD
jgi:3-oxoacyl-[acyl-carrier protein] reductase